MTQLAIITVTWNVRDLVLDCLRSVYDDLAGSCLDGQVYVVDNASSDGTAKAIRSTFPQSHLIEPGENLGFAGGNNLALREIGFPDGHNLPPFVLLLNPDTLIRPGALIALLDGMEDTEAGLGGARLVYGDGSFQHSAFAFPGLSQLMIDLFPVLGRLHESRLNGRYPRSLYESDRPFEIDHPLGATFMLRREVIQQTGLFDEQFHLYCEEVDWALRIRAAGWKAVCIPAAEVVHYGGQSTIQVRPQSVINLWTARLRLYNKHYSPLKRALAILTIRAGMNRLIQATARDSSQSEEASKALVDAYREVIRLTWVQ
ncbi:MAG: glycosyltransferase family 2 protein [Anaerolineae bacterium]|nr:glycosyltransferase family 2 protein [Anaerolineae bacterium]